MKTLKNYIDSVVNKVLRESLEEKADEIIDKLKSDVTEEDDMDGFEELEFNEDMNEKIKQKKAHIFELQERLRKMLDEYKQKKSVYTDKEGNPTHGATDENGNPICYSFESLWEFLEGMEDA